MIFHCSGMMSFLDLQVCFYFSPYDTQILECPMQRYPKRPAVKTKGSNNRIEISIVFMIR